MLSLGIVGEVISDQRVQLLLVPREDAGVIYTSERRSAA